ncbi:hypothetical protein EWB00_007960, partial [Schistosoma japonicum]
AELILKKLLIKRPCVTGLKQLSVGLCGHALRSLRPTLICLFQRTQRVDAPAPLRTILSHVKGQKSSCDNHRGISLTNIVSKL